VGLYTVLLADSAGADAGVLARFFSAEKGIPLIDAQRLARRAWGFLGENLDETSARALAEKAVGAGIKSTVVAVTEVPARIDPVSVHGAFFSEGQVDLRVGIPSVSCPIELSRIRLLSVANLRRDSLVTKTTKEESSTGRKILGLGVMLTTGIPIGLGGSKESKKTVTETEWFLFLDLFAEGKRWRLAPAGFDFSGLGADKGAAGPDNLRRLLIQFQRNAPQALLGRGAREWMAGRPFSVYDDESDLDRESRWLLALEKSHGR
jgi:hypothetical protein